MRYRRLLPILAASLLAGAAHAAEPAPAAASATQTPSADEMAKMMASAARYTKPGKGHEVLQRFVGSWTTQTRLIMAGQPTPPESGASECSWLMDGRWLTCDGQSTFMGAPLRTFMLIGYDNFKQSYVTTNVSSMDTSMIRSEGDMDPSGKALISYGTLDEYLTGEHDKMVKSVWRFEGPDRMVLEVHDLPIGETNTKVFEIAYERKPR